MLLPQHPTKTDSPPVQAQLLLLNVAFLHYFWSIPKQVELHYILGTLLAIPRSRHQRVSMSNELSHFDEMMHDLIITCNHVMHVMGCHQKTQIIDQKTNLCLNNCYRINNNDSIA